MNINEIEDFVRQNLAPEDITHTFRMRDMALRIAQKEGADNEIVEIAALLHDIGKIKNPKSHARWGAPIARHFLEKRGYDLAKIGKVVNCILKHNMEKPDTIEQKVICDADRLETIGALGAIRISVNHIKNKFTKPVDIPGVVKKILKDDIKLNTITAKIMAKELIDFDKKFIKLLNKQLNALKEE